MTCAWSSPFIWTEQGDAGGGEGGRTQAFAGEASIRITFISSSTRRQQKIRLGDSGGGDGGGGRKEEEPSRDLHHASDAALEGVGGSLCVAALTGAGFGEDNQLFRGVRH